MAKIRYIQSKFWDDNYIIELNPTEKLLFLYFLTNSHTELCGAYEINMRKILFDTGLSDSLVQAAMAKFQADKRIFYHKGWVFIPNFIKNQSLNPSVVKGIVRTLEKVPKWVKDRIDWAALGTASPQPVPSLADTKLNLTKLNLTKAGDKPTSKEKRKSNSQLLLDWFNSINPALGYKNKTEWDAADWVFQQKDDNGELISLDEVLAMVKYLHEHRLDEYAHVVTKPTQLKNKWAAINTAQEKKMKNGHK